jgi:hypothetical protein
MATAVVGSTTTRPAPLDHSVRRSNDLLAGTPGGGGSSGSTLCTAAAAAAAAAVGCWLLSVAGVQWPGGVGVGFMPGILS